MKKLLEQLAYGMGLINLSTNRPINFTGSPSPTYKALFEEVRNIQTILQVLFYNISLDLNSFSFKDEFYKYLESIRSPRKKRIHTFYLRSDYLLDEIQEESSVNAHKQYTYKQVEINTIAQCFSIFGPIVNKIHSYVNKNTLISNSDTKFVEYLNFVKTEYEELNGVEGTLIAMIDNETSPRSSNYLEKMKLIAMCQEREIEMVHIKMEEIEFEGTKLFYNKKEISIVYYRWFYNYDQYDEKTKGLRRDIEASDAVSLPSAEFQMVNSKAFQMILKDESVLKKYTDSPEVLKKHFGEFKPGEKTIPEGWILKDISEGGGHLNGETTESSFLMKKFNSPSFSNFFVLEDKKRLLVSELSFFGGLVAVDGEIKYNEEGGYMVRSKDATSLEGGVCVGAGGLDSVYFLE